MVTIVWLGKPFHRCFARFKGKLNVKTSITEAFATFLLLSYMKILCVSFDLLVPTQVYDKYGKSLGLYLFYDAELQYFGKQHLPYATLAIIITLVFNILPLLLLLLYPFQCFQQCLSTCRQRWHGLPIFIDAFQGCYKNGTETGTRDCRYFAALYFIARITLLIVYAATLSALFYAVGLLVLIALASLVAIIQPYRQELAVYNTADVILILMMAAWYGSILCCNMTYEIAPTHLKIYFALIFIMALLPLVYITSIVLRWLFRRRRVQQKLCQWFRTWKQSNQRQLLNSSELPDRIINPDSYNQDLIDPTTEEYDHQSLGNSGDDANETAY